MEEAYCSYETAKLLKENGFCERCFMCYEQGGKVFEGFGNWNKTDIYIAAPTHQMACAWLREVHNIFIEIGTSIDLNGDYHFSYTILDKECKYVRRGYTSFDWNYEDAVEAALKYSLENLI